MRESDIVSYLIKEVEIRKGEVRKLRWVGRTGAPDLVVLLRGAHFVEAKRPKKGPRLRQQQELDLLREHGASAHWVSTYEEVDNFIKEIMK